MVFWEIKSIQGSHQRVRSFQEVSSLLLNKPLSHELDFTFYYLFLFSFFLFFLVKKNWGSYGCSIPPSRVPDRFFTVYVRGPTLTKDVHQQEPAGSGNRT